MLGLNPYLVLSLLQKLNSLLQHPFLVLRLLVDFYEERTTWTGELGPPLRITFGSFSYRLQLAD